MSHLYKISRVYSCIVFNFAQIFGYYLCVSTIRWDSVVYRICHLYVPLKSGCSIFLGAIFFGASPTGLVVYEAFLLVLIALRISCVY